jgi:hypothetical protein
MKKKKLKKIAKYIHEIVSAPKAIPIEDKIRYIPFDLEVSNKTKKLVLDLMEYPDGVNVNLSEDNIILASSDITQIKKKIKSSNTVYNDDNYLEIHIEKNKGFTINLSYRKRTNYEDKNIYNDLIDIVRSKVIEINRQNFIDIWHKVMIESGIARDNNLEELLK